MVERWLAVPGFEGRYEVSNVGRVRSWVRPGRGIRLRDEPLILKPKPLRSGHLFVALGRGFDRQIHRLVLEAFRGMCLPGFEGSHLNGVPSDNRLANLAWETRSANFRRKRDHGTHNGGEAHPNAKLTQADVDAIRAITGESLTSIGRRFGVAQSTISRIRSGRRWGG